MVDIKRIGWVFFTILITLASALLLNYGAKYAENGAIMFFAIIFGVLSLNVLKLKVWGVIYRRYHLHESYPATALFFPIIYLAALVGGESHLIWQKISGIVLIITGVILIGQKQG